MAPPTAHQRRPRAAFTLLAPPLLRRSAICSAGAPNTSPPTPPSPSPPQPSSNSTPPSVRDDPDPARLDLVRTRMDSARTRVRLLNNRVVVRAGEAAIRRGETALSTAQAAAAATDAPYAPAAYPAPVADADTPDRAVLDNLRRDLRRLRRVTEEHDADPDALAVISKLQRITDAVDACVTERRNPSSAAPSATAATAASTAPAPLSDSALYSRDDLEDELEGAGPASAQLDLACVADPPASTPTGSGGGAAPADVGGPEFVASVRQKVIESGNSLKQRANDVGAGIEEKVGEFVRDDGSIDVDGLRNLVGALLDNANMTWQRLNGRTPAPRDGSAPDAASTDVVSSSLSVRDAEKEFQLQEAIGHLEKELIAASKEREAALRREDQLGKLMRAREIRAMDDGVSVLRRTLAVRVLQLEMEKIFVSVADEIENSDSEMMMEQRVLVVEFGDLDERLATLELFIDQEEPLLLEDDTLGDLASDILELKTRLGLDEALYSSATLDWPQVRQFFASTAKKSREGAEFYSRGLRLFAGDMRFAMQLIRRTFTGYTPSPREIRTIRRTGRDLLTLIPFTIVLIAPLTPVGHVLIFSFLQRYWPEFFPSTFSERRQAVMKRHEQYAKSIEAEVEDGQDGASDEEDMDEDGMGGQGGDGGKGKGSGGRLLGLKKLLFFGVMAKETAEMGDKRDERKSGNGKSEEGESGGEDGEETVHPVALSDLAETARDGERVARKRRNAGALDELHLAD